jgi:hypothetical protein
VGGLVDDRDMRGAAGLGHGIDGRGALARRLADDL